MTKMKKYDKEFKRQAVRLVREEGRSAAKVERNLETRFKHGFQRDQRVSGRS
ncbi:MAG: hypothetical protein SWO11_14360 [Thermodesulfobacteriota bacterium]|nr:hypothetical protein [Thermodesulfobacteriota bacterium]